MSELGASSSSQTQNEKSDLMEIEKSLFRCGNENFSPDKKTKREGETEEGRPVKKRKLWPQCTDPDAVFKVLLLKNFDEDQFQAVQTSLKDFIEEIEEEESGDEDMFVSRTVEPVDIQKCRFLQSEELKKEKKQQYRTEYQKRPEVQKKKSEKESDPETKKKRAEYAKKDEVKMQKKVRTSTRQGVYNDLKRTNPKLFRELERKALELANSRIKGLGTLTQ